MSEPDADVVTSVLRTGTLELDARMLDASNVTLVGKASLDGVTIPCVYKPSAGERPLWDFSTGTLSRREVATYEVSVASGWDLVPITVLRDDGPAGEGMCQQWIESDSTDVELLVDVFGPDEVPTDWHRVVSGSGSDGRPIVLAHSDDARLRNLAVLDAVVNNADRKGGHLLLDDTDHLYGIDHGVCFNEEAKLRTFLWGWAGTPLLDEQLAVLRALRAQLSDADDSSALRAKLVPLLTSGEIAQTLRRVDVLIAAGSYPAPSDEWPALPWPIF